MIFEQRQKNVASSMSVLISNIAVHLIFVSKHWCDKTFNLLDSTSALFSLFLNESTKSKMEWFSTTAYTMYDFLVYATKSWTTTFNF